MADIYALLVGINAYPVKPLQGCINDVSAVEEYLKFIYTDDVLKIKKVTDDETDKPERNIVID